MAPKRSASQSKMTTTMKRTKSRAKIANSGLMQRSVSGPRFMKLRYSVNSTNTISIDGIDIIGAAGSMTISTTAAATIYTRAKIVYATLIGTPPAAGSINQAKLEFGYANFSVQASRDLMVNSSNNPNVGPKLYAKPRKGTPAGEFFSSTTANLISLAAPINSILEVGVQVVDYEPGATVQTYTGSFTSSGTYLKRSPDTNLTLLT